MTKLTQQEKRRIRRFRKSLLEGLAWLGCAILVVWIVFYGIWEFILLGVK